MSSIQSLEEQGASVFKLGAGGRLVPTSFEGAEIGNRVRWAGNYDLFTIIGQEISGWTIANGKGETHTGQQIESLSPYTRITVETSLPNASAEEIEAIKAAVAEKQNEDAEAYRAERAQHQADYEKYLAEIKKKYPNAAQKGSRYARAAKNLKAELKQAFPLVDFSVKSETFAGGSAVNVEWTDGCTREQVEKISAKYQQGRYDSLEEIYNYNRSAYTEALQEHLGGAKYVSTQRNYSEAVKAQVREAIEKSAGAELPAHELDTLVYRALQGAEIYGEFTGLEIAGGSTVARFAPAPSSSDNPTAATATTAARAAGASVEFTTGEFTHTIKGTPCYVATLASRVEKQQFAEIREVAKSCGGYYSSFARGGAIAGFIFDSSEKREEFLNRFKN